MKTVIAIILVASTAGWIRYDHWSELREEAARLESVSLLPGVERAGEAPPRSDERPLSSNVPESLGSELLQLMSPELAVHSDERRLLQMSVVDQLAGLDPRALSRWMAALEADASAPADLRAKVGPTCVQALLQVHPAAAMKLIGLLPEGKIEASIAIMAFTNWAACRPGEALRWYDEIEASGWAMAKDGPLLLRVSVEQARIDPDKVLARSLSHEGTKLGEILNNLGGQVGMQLRTAEENRSFLVSLERASRKAPESKLLGDIRQGYIGQLTSSLPEWPIEDAITLVETGFRPDEKLAAMRQAGSCLSREDPDRWADWVVDAAAPVDPEHPLMSLIISWTMFDPFAPGRWLAKEPAGSLRDLAMSVYLSRVESFDLANATSCLEALPDSPQKAEVLRRVRQRENGQ
ncbi:MAG: hypothetical protein EOP84_06100 [Verrucomicrobiaceae bacterium]|nr:MAG: hypothetical protein EOP84_06100 [Verrucomicrobiaceae bacterium]